MPKQVESEGPDTKYGPNRSPLGSPSPWCGPSRQNAQTHVGSAVCASYRAESVDEKREPK